MTTKDIELLARYSSSIKADTYQDSAWDLLQLSFDSGSLVSCKTAAIDAARVWRRLPESEQSNNVRLLSGIWRYHHRTGNLLKLSRFGEFLLHAGRRRGLDQLQAEGLLALGLAYMTSGKAKQAVDSLELAKSLFISNSNARDAVRASILLADAFRLSNDRTSALAILARARLMCLEIEEISLLGSVSQTLGNVNLERGALQEAEHCFNFVIRCAELLGLRKRLLRGTLGLAAVKIRRGLLSEGKNLLGVALSLCQESEGNRERALCLEYAGDLAMQESNWSEALTSFARMNKLLAIGSTSVDCKIELHRKLAELWMNYGDARRSLYHSGKGAYLARHGGEGEDLASLRRTGIEAEWLLGLREDPLADLLELASRIEGEGLGYEHLLTAYRITLVADSKGLDAIAAEWWARVEYLAKSCGAEPLIERWRKERQDRGSPPKPPSDELEGEALNARLAEELPKVDLFAFGIITRSRLLHEQAASIMQIAPTKVPVLIHGESGTGKELFAKLVHDLSPRIGEAFLAINCGALPADILESELFGHRRGAFTGAMTDKPGLFRAAHKGTLFLDEIGEMSAPAQTKLLRVLEAGELRRVGDTHVEHVDVRIVAATNVDLENEVKTGKFRRDLYYRLKGLEIFLPPLRERLADIPILAEHFLARSNDSLGKSLMLPFETKQWLMGLPWLGNVRELRLAVERAAALGPSKGLLQPHHFMNAQQHSSKGSLSAELEEIERARVLHALEASNWNKAGAAKLLGMSRTTLVGKIKRLGIEDPEPRD